MSFEVTGGKKCQSSRRQQGGRWHEKELRNANDNDTQLSRSCPKCISGPHSTVKNDFVSKDLSQRLIARQTILPQTLTSQEKEDVILQDSSIILRTSRRMSAENMASSSQTKEDTPQEYSLARY